MYIVSILDDGKERIFKATAVVMADDEVFIICGDRTERFQPRELLAVISASTRPEITYGLNDHGSEGDSKAIN